MIVAATLLAALSNACEPLMESPQETGLESSPESGDPASPVLHLRLYRDNSRNDTPLVYSFWDFDRGISAHQPVATEKAVPPGGILYEGDLLTVASTATPVFVQTAPHNTIDRVLIQINGQTGLDARHFLSNIGHKIAVMVSHRGLHEDDLRYECPLGAGLVNCLRSASTRDLFRTFNPKANGRDVVDVMRVIAGEDTLTVDGSVTSAARFFAVGDRRVNIETGSYGATILAYALQAFRDLTDRSAAKRNGIGRVFIDGPSAPYERVITDGFRNTKVALNNMLDALGLTAQQRSSVLNAMKERHTAPVMDTGRCPSEPPSSVSADCLSSGMIWRYLTARYESIAAISIEAERTSAMEDLKRRLIAIPAEPATSGPGLDAVNAIYSSRYLSSADRSAKTWESSRLMLMGGDESAGLEGTFHGFTSRFAHICSAYVLRADGDSQAAFDVVKEEVSNDPYWYGFLISYREILSICPQASAGFMNGIVPPRSLGVAAEAVVQFSAGTDDKHHQDEMDEMAAFFAPSTRRLQVFLPEAVQWGGTPVQAQRPCFQELLAAAFAGDPGDVHIPVSCLD